MIVLPVFKPYKCWMVGSGSNDFRPDLDKKRLRASLRLPILDKSGVSSLNAGSSSGRFFIAGKELSVYLCVSQAPAGLQTFGLIT